MSLRSKTQKAKTYGTPSAPSPSAAPKAPSPRATGGTPSAPSPTAQKSSPTSPRSAGITQTQAGQTVQEQFKTKVQTLTAPIRSNIDALTITLHEFIKAGEHYPSNKQRADLYREKIDNEYKKIKEIEEEQHNIELENNVNQIIATLESGKVIAPDYFQNNIAWVKTGEITQQAFLDSYYYLSNQGIIHTAPIEPVIEEPIIEESIIQLPEILPEAEAQIEPIPIIIPEINDLITNNMITQKLDNFSIVDGRAKGTITFTANNNFNPYYYGKTIINLIQFKTLEGANILPTIKTNNLRFTATERTEILHYDEDMNHNSSVTVESFVWEWMDKPAGAFSKVLRFNIDTNGKIQTEGFLGAGMAISAIAFSIALGYIIDQRRKK